MAMLLLVFISAVGIYVISFQHPVGPNLNRYEREAVGKYMAVAGVHSAVARISQGASDSPPYVRYFNVRRNMTGRYSVSFNQSSKALRPGLADDSSAKEYVVISEGSIVQSGGVRHLVRATVLCLPKELKCRIALWEEEESE